TRRRPPPPTLFPYTTLFRSPQPPSAMPQLSGKLLTKLQTPQADRLVADCDPTLGQQLFNVPQAETEAVVQPDGIRNDLRRKAVRSEEHTSELQSLTNLVCRL